MADSFVGVGTLQPGFVLGGKYRLERILGAGAMGTVYEAVHEKLGRTVAIKVLNPELGEHGLSLSRFRREAETITRLGHPNIVAVYDFGTCPNGAPYFAMEVVSGETLRQRLDRGPLGDDEIVNLFAPLLSALAAAHAQGIVHRDLKPENVMLVKRGTGGVVVKLLDFGVAKIRNDDQTEQHVKTKDLVSTTDSGSAHGSTQTAASAQALSDLATACGAMMGTPAYMSPEQIKAQVNIDGRADIYAVGIMLFEAVTGQRPFAGSSLASLLGAHLFEAPAKASEAARRLNLPNRHLDMSRLDRVIERTLGKDPEQRYPDCLTLRDDLDVVWGGRGLWKHAGLGQVVTTQPLPKSPVAGNRRLWLTGILVLGTLLVIPTVIWFSRRTPTAHRYPAGTPAGEAFAVFSATEKHRGLADNRATAQALEAVQHRALLPFLTELLAQESGQQRLLLATAYVIGRPGDSDLLGQAHRVAQTAVGISATQAQALRLRLGDKTAVAVLDTAAASENLSAEARLWAGLALSQAGHAQIASLIKLKETLGRSIGTTPKTLRRLLLIELVRNGDAATEKHLREQTEQTSGLALAVEALEWLAAAGKTDATQKLRALRQAKQNPEAMALAVLALARLGDETVGPELRALLDQEPYRLRATAAAGYLRTQSDLFLSPLRSFLSSNDALLQKTAAAALLALSAKDHDVRGN